MRARLGGPDGWVSGGALRTRPEQAPTLSHVTGIAKASVNRSIVQ
jgi:hypothetical protein